MVMVFFNTMKDLLIPIDPAGRVVLPKNVRQELAITPGDTFKVSIHGTAVTLTPTKETTGFVRKGKALVFSTTGKEILSEKTVNDILNNIRETPLQEVKSLLSRKPRR